MLRFSLFGFPIRVEWFFWLSCILLGGGLYAKGTEAWIKVLIWAVAVFVSIMVHELGHAFAARKFGQRAAISLHGLGGLTHFQGPTLTRTRNILVSLAGPGAGFALGAMAWLTFPISEGPSYLTEFLWSDLIFINFVWGFVNLLPIMPLDGGQVLRDILGPSNLRIARVTGAVVGAGAAVFAASIGMYFAAVMMGVLAYMNFNGIQQPGGVVRDPS